MATTLNTEAVFEAINSISFTDFELRGTSVSTSTNHRDISVDLKQDKNNKIAYWGHNNLLPDELIALVGNNTIALGLINFKRDMIVGPAHFLYQPRYETDSKGKVKEIKEVVENAEISDFLEENDFREYMMKAAMDYSFFENTFTECVRTKNGKKYLFEHKDASYCRVQAINSKNCYMLDDWDNYKTDDLRPIPLYSKGEATENKFIIHSKSYFPGSKYYGVPTYIGARNWLIYTNKIPVYKIANMENGSNIRFHIQLPTDYFTRLYPAPEFSDEDRKKKEREFKESLEKFLSGAQNAGKMVLSKFTREMDKVIPGLIIEPVEYKLNDAAYNNDYEQSNQAFTSAIGIDPSIANIHTTGKLSSGSDKRNGFNIYTNTRLFAAREKILEPIYKIFKLNGFDSKIRIGFKDFELQTLDENKEGVKEI